MAKLEKELNKAVEAIVEYSISLEPTKNQIHKYVRAHSLLNILVPSTARKAWAEVDRRLESHHIQNYR